MLYTIPDENEPSRIDTDTLKAGDCVTIPPRVAHMFVSTTPAIVLSMGTGSDPFDDRERVDFGGI